jgi:glycosyltransferase involved in cell wall biosynthesis
MQIELKEKKQLTLIIPTYNEKENIQPLLSTLIPYLDTNVVPFEILVIDDSSMDGTREIVTDMAQHEKRIKLFTRTKEKGIGSAIFFGLQHAQGDILIPIMADSSESYADILELYTVMNEKDYDVLFTNRFRTSEKVVDYPFFKKLCNRSLNLLAALLYQYPYTDITNAFKAYNNRIIRKITITTPGFEALLEIPLLCLFKGRSFGEIPVSGYQRKRGHSKLNLLRDGFKYFSVLLKYLPRRYISKK